MSDLGSTPPAETAKLSSPSSASLAFLVHSPDTVQRNLPPDVDNKPLARQKRRRTSPEDQKILEAEYQQNPKPDKVARAEIVKRVALGEKEVQIWFQNRRQNSRRKSRPLDPHEIQSHLHSSGTESAFLSSSTTHTDELEEPEEDMPATEGANVQAEGPGDQPDSTNQPAALEPVSATECAADGDRDQASHHDANIMSSQKTDGASQTAGPAEMSSSQPIPSSQDAARKGIGYFANRRSASFVEKVDETPLPGSSRPPGSQESSSVGYLANRRSASFVKTFEEPARPDTSRPPAATPQPREAEAAPSSAPAPSPIRTLKKTGSFVRLSMTEDGKARVISNEDSPSPPRSQPTPNTFVERSGGLRRSQSAAGLNERLRQAQELSPLNLSRSFSGRSRDSRAWEFWCDSDARNSLTEKANQESSGSAADAIELIRSTSRAVLQSRVNKRVAQPMAQSSIKRQRVDGRTSTRQPLARSSSSTGRLQSKSGSKKQDADGFEIPQTESDKENWEPHTHVHAGSKRKLTSSQSAGQPRRRALGENTNIMSHNSSLGSMMAREKAQKSPVKGRLKNSQSIDPEDDEEIAAFMGSAARNNDRTNVSSGEELGCVQGLLKLSQGNWR